MKKTYFWKEINVMIQHVIPIFISLSVCKRYMVELQLAFLVFFLLYSTLQ